MEDDVLAAEQDAGITWGDDDGAIERYDDAVGAQHSVRRGTSASGPGHSGSGSSTRGGRARNYVFTLWDDFSTINEIIARNRLPECEYSVRGEQRIAKIRFLCGQFELSPETRREHFQGYIQFFDKVAGITLMQSIFGPCHVEVARGSVKSCTDYCTKEETRLRGPFTFGIAMGQGTRSDLLGFRRAIQEGQTNKQLWEGEHFATMLRHYKTVPLLRSYFKPVDRPRYGLSSFCVPALVFDPKKCWVIVGATGIGKTHFAQAHFERPLTVRHLDVLAEFDPQIYDGIVFDDLGWRQSSFSDILNVIDMEIECQLHIRYTVAHIAPGTRRIFTSNREDLFESYKLNDDELNAIKRRVEFYKPVILRNAE